MGADSFNLPRLGVGFAEERRVELQQANKLKQELYAQQKKIQFSNLLERSNEDVVAYIESQENLFISASRPKSKEATPPSATETQSFGESASESGLYREKDDRDGVDFFNQHAFRTSSSKKVRSLLDSQDEFIFDPEARTHETLFEHLLKQLRMESKYENVPRELKDLCEKIIMRLDSKGYFTVEANDHGQGGATNLAAYPDYDEETELEIDRFDDMFEISSTRETRLRMKKALDDYFATNDVSKESRVLARREFDSIVGRKTTKEERVKAKLFLDKLIDDSPTIDPLDTLFPRKPSDEDQALAERALAIVQSLDPPGVGARNFQEALLLRIRSDTPYAKELKRIVSDCFDDFCKRKIGNISEKTGISAETLSKIYEQPFPFSPSPEEIFSVDRLPVRNIQPEVVVEETTKGRWTVRLDESQQEIKLSPEYVKMLVAKKLDKDAKDYLRRQYFEAQALIDALSNRNATLLRVAKAIVDFQQGFFVSPNATPQPLTQQQIADKLGLDSSTVSRACNDKWMATPRGLIAFKVFFPKAVTGNVTSADVADLIKQIVDQEDKNHPYSDEKITDILKEKYDVNVSRKTVQEHRDRLEIPNSRSRKRIG